MRRTLLSSLAVLALAAPSATAGSTAVVSDVAGDANGSATVDDLESAGAGNQAYADILSVRWTPASGGFRVTMTLAAPPVPPQGVELVYRNSGRVDPSDAAVTVGTVFYTTPVRNGSVPQSALRDTLRRNEPRFTALAPPVISGRTITWFVPLEALPRELGTTVVLHELQSEVRLSEDLRGPRLGADSPVFPGASGFNVGVLDAAYSTAKIKIG